jgi:hypothetical protein
MQNNLKNRRPLFWDINENDIEKALVESVDWVVVRVFEFGSIEDIFDVIELYGKQKVRETLTRETLQPVSAAMAFLFLDVDVHRKYAA